MINLESLEINDESSLQPSNVALKIKPESEIETGLKPVEAVASKSNEETSIRAELNHWKNQCAAMAAERELAMAISGESLLPGVSGQLIQLLRERVITKFNDKNLVEVFSIDGRSVSESVKDWLKQPEFHHFRPAITRGGTASRTETQVTERSLGDLNKEKSLNEMVINQWRQKQNHQSGLVQKPMWPKV